MINLKALDVEERAYQMTSKEGWQRRTSEPPRTAPPQLTRAQLDAVEPKLLRRYNEARKIWHANLGPYLTPQMRSVTQEMLDIIDSNRQDGGKVKPSVLLDGWPGLGKTTLITAMAVKFWTDDIELRGPLTRAGHERIPVANVSLSATTTMKAFSMMLLEFYGHPGAYRGSAQLLASRATTCILECETKLVLVDDVHFLDLKRRSDRELANHFKWLATQFPVTFVFAGVGLEQRRFVTEGLDAGELALSQTARRWTTMNLRPFRITTKSGKREWRQILATIERDLCLVDKWQGMLADDLADYLFARTTGHFASLMSLIGRGAHRAISTGQERLTADLLDKVKIDAAAEQARRDIEAAFAAGRLTTHKQESESGPEELVHPEHPDLDPGSNPS